MEEKLIELVRLQEVIYDHSSSEYRDQNVRQQAWEGIAAQLKRTADNAKTKWDKLRRCFCRAWNRRLSTKSGQTTKQIVPWKLEPQMQFLLPYLEGRRTHGNLQDSKKKEESQVLPEEPNKDDDVDEQEIKDPDEVAEGTVEVEHNTSAPQQTPSQDLILHAENTKWKRMSLSEKENLKQKVCRGILSLSKIWTRPIFSYHSGSARMMKKLAKVEQASVKLTVSNAILQAEL